MALEPVKRFGSVKTSEATASTVKLRLSIAQIKDLANLSLMLGPLSCTAWHNHLISTLEKLFTRSPDLSRSFGNVDGFFRFFTQSTAQQEDREFKLTLATQIQFQFDRHVGAALEQPRELFSGWAPIFLQLKILSACLNAEVIKPRAIDNARESCRLLIKHFQLPLEIEIAE